MTTVISVRFRNGTKTYYFDPRGIDVQTGDDVVVETAQGLEFAQWYAIIEIVSPFFSLLMIAAIDI